MNEALKEIINLLKELSPSVWQAALVQVQTQAILNFILAGVFLAASLSLFFLGKKFSKEVDLANDEAIPVIFLFVLAILAFIPVLGNFYWGFLRWFSPDWAAIQLILEQVK